MTLFVRPRNLFGTMKYYPRCETSLKFCELLKQDTLSDTDLKRIKGLGYEIKTKEEIL